MTEHTSSEKYFTWRGRDVTRVENLSDIVFALSLTLIVASSVPTSFDALIGLWREAIAVAMCFALVLLIWSKHHAFHRRYGLDDGRTIFLNSIVLFLIMIFAYPLKYLALFMVNLFTGYFDTLEAVDNVMPLSRVDQFIVIYAMGYAAVFGVFALLYAHALQRADDLGLSAAERIVTRLEVDQGIAAIGVSLIAAVSALALPQNISYLGGSAYFLIGPVMYWLSRRAYKQADAAQASAGG
ncbi:TMEM175 family protein [Hyphobacterium sp. HN65]|uniref:TMEM175 family protein n=1 Tax=Hyphobacterium lacteum TaxID=3116575 RepID=A0ABU7LLN6_9PROT|nr:TMEM175 family protein [Hyphobacterium sp. HN65]MEE2524838.1 TMEM175 family protein [Hyphobacterium sp. HN65]